MNDDRSWFWNQGYADGLAGERNIVPDEARHLAERHQYYDGYDAGKQDREARADSLIEDLTSCGFEIPETMLDEEENAESAWPECRMMGGHLIDCMTQRS